MRHTIVAVLLAFALPLTAATTNNDDSCDIGTFPAATLLLPYFAVDIGPAGAGRTTIFSITNVSAIPQVVTVTIWTDWAFPVLTFPIFLTGYDVQPINLYDVIVRGLIGSTQGTSTGSPNARDSSGHATNPYLGTQPLTNLANPNFLASAATECAPGRLPGLIPGALTNDIRAVFTTGRSTGALIHCTDGGSTELPVGSNHGTTAVGYVTIDLVATCSPMFATDARYWDQLLYDNVLMGDYANISSDRAKGNYAGGNPMVHIRAIPEGGGPGGPVVTDLPFTFYDRLTTAANRRVDRRQPLPSTFAARWIAGSNAAFDTNYTIWREAMTGANASCADLAKNLSMGLGEIVRFDERENAWVWGSALVDPPLPSPVLPATSSVGVTSTPIPFTSTTDSGGWMYFNLMNGGSAVGAPYSAARAGYGGGGPNTRDVSQNWVTLSMFAEGRFGVEYDATMLGNGCSPAAPFTPNARDENTAAGRIGPAKNVNP